MGSTKNSIVRFAQEYGWWRVVAIPVLSIITIVVLIDAFSGTDSDDSASHQADQAHTDSFQANGDTDEDNDSHRDQGPDPAAAEALRLQLRDLPPGGPYARSGEGTFRAVGSPGLEVGQGEELTLRYATEVEDGVDTSGYGGDDAVASLIDATLADPRGWTYDPRFKFVHVGADEDPDTRIRLTSAQTTAELCGQDIELETSCHTTITGESTVILNESRWVRGASPFEGDLGNYRQYLVNHEVGHALGYPSHQACTGMNKLAPVMMQQTISLNNATLYEQDPTEVYPDEDVECSPNPWPYPKPLPEGAALPDLHDPESE